MKFLISLAWKNLSRYRKRTIITASAIAVGLAVFLWTDSFLLGMEVDSERNLIWYESSSARVMHPDYWEERTRLPLKYVIISASYALCYTAAILAFAVALFQRRQVE